MNPFSLALSALVLAGLTVSESSSSSWNIGIDFTNIASTNTPFPMPGFTGPDFTAAATDPPISLPGITGPALASGSSPYGDCEKNHWDTCTTNSWRTFHGCFSDSTTTTSNDMGSRWVARHAKNPKARSDIYPTIVTNPNDVLVSCDGGVTSTLSTVTYRLTSCDTKIGQVMGCSEWKETATVRFSSGYTLVSIRSQDVGGRRSLGFRERAATPVGVAAQTTAMPYNIRGQQLVAKEVKAMSTNWGDRSQRHVARETKAMGRAWTVV
ncbi:hypothetical protein T440DRAFT_558998 [Plenodomus tracheiphilus IPT5]|uniref:Uncharacterized protein n=1 Tax=Plenodomus tracheiphilus IPT5 TaxID=1408161 RepID=A0A6A7AQF3_9PLEO|nr:hypothetical protein T440DRAFT_558998 [Plenodomus tracheiphilus IPT5]